MIYFCKLLGLVLSMRKLNIEMGKFRYYKETNFKVYENILKNSENSR